MKPRKKNKFFTFIFSFVPGAAEMYMGFMKSGFSLLITFVAPFLIMGMLYSMDYLGLLSVIVYVVAFFHAINYAAAPDEEFSAIEDKFIWEEYFGMGVSTDLNSTYKKWTAISLIFFGIYGIWNAIRDYIFKFLANVSEEQRQIIKGAINSVPRIAFSILIIIAGIVIIRGKKKDLLMEKEDGEYVNASNDK